MNLKIAQFNLNSVRNDRSTADIFVAQVDAVKEALAGKLFVMAELENNRAQALKIINFLIDRLSHNYYQSEKIILRERMPSLLPEHIFETALAKTNKQFKEFLKNEKIKMDLSRISITAGLIFENKLHFSNSGKNKILLLYPEKNSQSPAGYIVSDLGGDGGDKDGQNKLFASVVSGHIPAGAALLASNEALPEYLSQKQIIDIITNLPPAGASEQIKQVLSSINSYVAFLGVIIKRPSETSSGQSQAPLTIRLGQDSVAKLNQTEDNTENLLSPSGLFNIRKWTGWLRRKDADKGAQTSAAAQLSLNEGIYVRRQKTLFLQKFKKAAKTILILAQKIIYAVFKAVQNKRIFSQLPAAVWSAGRKGLARLKDRYRQMSKKSKLVLYAAIICLLLFSLNTFSHRQDQIRETESQQIDELIKDIEKKQNQAEAHLLYSNEEGALALFNEIEKLLAEFPQDDPERQGQYLEFRDKFLLQLEVTQRVDRRDGLEILADFGNLNPQAQAENILTAGTQILAGDSSQRSVYAYNTGNQAATTIASLDPAGQTFLFPISQSQSAEYFNQSGLTRVNLTDNSLSIIGLSLPADVDAQDIKSMAVYNERVYLADENRGQIYRYDRSGSAYAAPRAWLNNAAEFTDISGMAIDGSIYILERNGKLSQFLLGAPQELRLKIVSPALEQADALYVSPEQDLIYVLDDLEKRIIAYNKNGDFLKQYRSDSFTDLRDLDVDEAAGLIYVLNGNTVLKLAVEEE